MTLLAERGVPVPMRDGARLATDVYRPAAGRVPALLQRTPYGTDLPPLGRPANGLRLVDGGYAVVLQDVRGRGRSQGRFAPFVQEAADGEDTIAWLAAQEWWDGRLGMLGSSYCGHLQWALAERAPERVRAVAPHVAGADPAAWFSRGGAREWGFSLWWALSAHALAEAARRRDERAVDEVWAVLDRLDDAYRRGPGELPAVLDRLAPYARGWIEAPERTGGAVDPAALAVPALLIGGWHDVFLEHTLASYRARQRRGAPTRLVVGPWSHTVWTGQFPLRDYGRHSSMDAEDITAHHLRWFDRWVRGEGEGEEGGVRFFLLGADRWEEAGAWPPPGVGEVRLSLAWDGGAGTLGATSPQGKGAVSVPFDPLDPVPTLAGQTLMAGTYAARCAGPWDLAPLLERDDVLVFSTPPLERPLELLGTVRLRAAVATAAAGGDLACALLELGPDGSAMHVLDGVRRLPARPGPTSATVELGTTAVRIEAGQRLALTLARSNFPRFDLNPGGPVSLLPGETALVLPTREPAP